MKVSELINQLQTLQDALGDVPVAVVPQSTSGLDSLPLLWEPIVSTMHAGLVDSNEDHVQGVIITYKPIAQVVADGGPETDTYLGITKE